jgi:(p)ppGpp synthase/HD superfamily hydrolase
MTDSAGQPMLTDRFQQAFALASRVHATQVRKRTTIPYLAHLMSVAALVLGCSDTVAVPGQAKPPWRDRKQGYLDKLAGETDPDVLLVSACDKLHNTRSVLADLRAEGAAVWQRFNQPDPSVQLWYYSSLADIYRDHGLDPRLQAELDRTVRAIADEVAAPAGR